MVNDFDDLSDTLVGRQFVSVTDGNLDWVLHEVLGNVTDFLWPSSSEHKCLSFWVLRGPHDVLDIFFKSLLQHTISFIQGQVSQLGQVDTAFIHQIDQSPRSSNDNIGSLQITTLLFFRNTTVKTNNVQTFQIGQFLQVVVNLRSQFSGWGNSQHFDSLGLVVDNVVNGWDTKGKSLTGTSLSNTDNITTR
ncbi:hypothetical protein WICPIJ_002633 [Wickerhamomyces pijperi]|uniref:Uncharacterized protein n=1 Tax=Wickerhamomyces pijperi TaxID=599730 RepID=A0A9P8QBC7_WICPI|nr:hypothetical protein WICPIJ_002633 [Wickerhamomyces pijperi]